MSVISRLIKKQCITVRYKSPLPCSSYFANQLFKEYAENDVITKNGIEKLLKKLKIGEHTEGSDESSHEHDDHDDHDHRRRRSLDSSNIQGKQFVLQRRYRRETDDHDHSQESTKYQKV